MSKIEDRTLKGIIKKSESNKSGITISFGYQMIIWLAMAFPIMFIIGYAKEGQTEIAVIIAFTLVAGWFAGISIVLRNSERCWPFIKPYLKLDEMKKRVGEKNI